MPKVKHVGLLKFKEGTSQEQIDQLFADLMDLTETIDGIEDYVSGPNNSPEGLSDGLTHGFVITFRDAAARDAYLPHPEHERFTSSALPLIDKAVIVDFEV